MERIELQRHDIFINAYGVSAIILHDMLNYKLIMNGKEYKIGFPSNSLTKVLNTLEDKKISYVIYEEDNSIKLEYDYKNLNDYNKEYKMAIDKLEIDTKVNLIYTKIKKLKIEDLNIFLDRLLEWLK